MMLSGAILSGGMSSRMGQEKGLTKLNGRPFVAHVAEVMHEAADEVIVAVARGMKEDYMAVLGRGVLVVEDQGLAASPLQGLVTALGAASGEYVLVSPCDTPLLRAEVCRAVAGRAVGMDGAVPRVRGFIEPLHAAFRRRTAFPVFHDSLREGRFKVGDTCRKLELEIVEESALRALDPDLDSFWNLNTPKDVELAEKNLKRR